MLDRDEVRRVISNAYYNARNNRRTMEQAADDAADGVMRLARADLQDNQPEEATRG